MDSLRDDRAGESLNMDSDYVLRHIIRQVDLFRESLRGNTRIKRITLSVEHIIFDISDVARLGEVIGNLTALRELTLKGSTAGVNALAPVLRHTRQIRVLSIHIKTPFDLDRSSEATELELPSFSTALSHHPELEEIKLHSCPIEVLTSVCHTLPKLRFVEIEWDSTLRPRPTIQSRAMSDLWRTPMLRHVCFTHCTISELCMLAISEGLVNADCRLTELVFSDCCLAEDRDDLLASALEHNTSLKRLLFSYCSSHTGFLKTFVGSLRRCLTVNRTLQRLNILSWTSRGVTLDIPDTAMFNTLDGVHHNETLQVLTLPGSSWTSDGCDALRATLETNVSLQSFKMQATDLTDDNWGRIIPFLRVNSTLESLEIMKSLLTKAVIPDTVDALERNSNLQSFTLLSRSFTASDLIEFVGSLNTNTTLKKLRLGTESYHLNIHGEEVAAAAVAAVRKNYGLVKWCGWITDWNRRRLVECIFRLNEAGRHYLVHDPASRAKGVRVLSQVNDELTCLFLHLLENPLLCACGERPRPSRKRKPGECN